MNKTKIEWTDMTWNPIKGLCPMGCYYCYARRFYKRFKWNPEIRLDEKELLRPLEIKKPKKIFVCSTIELFHPEIPKEFRDEVFKIITNANWQIFQILTKLPHLIDRDMPDNVWLGVSISSLEIIQEEERIWWLLNQKAKIKFVSLEPWLGQEIRCPSWLSDIDWLIIGGITNAKGSRPTKEAICKLVEWVRDFFGIPVFIKDNLADIWGEPLIQEFPKGA
ncbi:MAG: DUF5131 family protein [Candidatus Aminicenantes bacterium]|nr:DUF5131 family protein [Candidatus Aminicenantes bacterium]